MSWVRNRKGAAGMACFPLAICVSITHRLAKHEFSVPHVPATGTEQTFSGQTVRIRFCLRDAKVYGVTEAK
jgi:hypothetical protein